MGTLLAILLGAYLIGCLHGSTVAQILSGVNLKETGVKNAGASNATIVLGKKYGILVAAIDIAKGAVAILFVYVLFHFVNYPETTQMLYLFVASAAAVIGHNFPFYMKFNGGKGTATIIGVLIALNWKLGLIALLLFLVVTVVTDYIVLGVMTLYISLVIIAIWKYPTLWTLLIALILMLIAVLKHIENFKRIKNGEEKKVSAVLWKKKS